MSKQHQTFTCHVQDWHMARAYSYVGVPQALQVPTKKVGMSWLALPFLLFAIGAIGSIINMHTAWILLIVISLIFLLVNYQRQSKKSYNEYVSHYQFASHSEHNSPIPYVSLTEQELNLHLFKPDGSISHKLRLNEIDTVIITMLNLTAQRQRLPFLINKRAKALGEYEVPLLYGRTDTYQLVVYTKQKALYQTAITIPEGWFKDDAFAEVIRALQEHRANPIYIEDTTAKDSLIKQYFRHYGIQLPNRRRTL